MANTAISAVGLTMKYGGNTVLNDPALSIPEGEVFGVHGHNGAGKTTAVNIMAALPAPWSGTART